MGHAFFHTRGMFRVAAFAASLLAVPTVTLADVGIEVVMNQAKIVKLSRPADTIVIGNPEIADAAVQDATARRAPSCIVAGSSCCCCCALRTITGSQ